MNIDLICLEFRMIILVFALQKELPELGERELQPGGRWARVEEVRAEDHSKCEIPKKLLQMHPQIRPGLPSHKASPATARPSPKIPYYLLWPSHLLQFPQSFRHRARLLQFRRFLRSAPQFWHPRRTQLFTPTGCYVGQEGSCNRRKQGWWGRMFPLRLH